MNNSGPNRSKINPNGNDKRLHEYLLKCSALKHENDKFKKAPSCPSNDK